MSTKKTVIPGFKNFVSTKFDKNSHKRNKNFGLVHCIRKSYDEYYNKMLN